MPNPTAQMQTALARPVLQPVFIGRLDILGDPVTVWDGPGLFAPTGTGDTALDGQIFSSIAGAVALSNIKEGAGISDAVTATLFGIDIDDPLLRQVVRDNRVWRGRRAWLWLGLLDQTDETKPVVVSPTRLKSAYMTQMQIERDTESGVVVVTIDEDEARAQGPVYRYTDQRRFYPTDTAADFVHKLANSPQGVHGRDPVRVGGFGRGIGNGAIRRF